MNLALPEGMTRLARSLVAKGANMWEDGWNNLEGTNSLAAAAECNHKDTFTALWKGLSLYIRRCTMNSILTLILPQHLLF